MGQCIAGKISKIRPDSLNENFVEQIEEMRNRVITEIHNFHKITLKCTNGIETCAMDNNKSLAVLLKLKYNYVKLRSILLQDFVKRLDEALTNDKFSKKKEIVHDGKKLLQDIRDPLINDDTALILENNQEYNSKFLNEIKKTGINIKEIENSIDQEFEQKKVNPNRRRYTKKLSPS